MKYTTHWKLIDGGKRRIRAEYGTQAYSGQDPYITVTGEIQRRPSGRGRWMEDSFGCLHDDIAKHWPQLRELIRFHLCAVRPDGSIEPMHYVANAVYWADIVAGIRSNTDYGPDPLKAFQSTVCADKAEALPDLHPIEDEDAEAYRFRVAMWCESRREALRAQVAAALDEFGLGGAL